MFGGVGRYISEVFQDLDGGFSMKRLIAFALIGTFLLVTLYVVLNGVTVHAGAKAIYSIPAETLTFLQGVLDKCIEGLKWVITLITAERTPQAVAAFKGNKVPPVTGEQ